MYKSTESLQYYVYYIVDYFVVLQVYKFKNYLLWQKSFTLKKMLWVFLFQVL